MSTRRPTRITCNRPSLIAAWMVRSERLLSSAAVLTEKQIAIGVGLPLDFLRRVSQTCIDMKTSNYVNSNGRLPEDRFWYRCKRVDFHADTASWELSQAGR